jgi:hypothetical protein
MDNEDRRGPSDDREQGDSGSASDPSADTRSTAYMDFREEWDARPPETPPVDIQGSRARSGLSRRPDETTIDSAIADSVTTLHDNPNAFREGGRPARGRRNGRVRGVAHNIEIRRDRERQVLVFRVDAYDGSGDRVAPVSVEIRSLRSGQLSDGEEVEVSGTWSKGTLSASEAMNLTTGAMIRGRNPRIRHLLIAAAFGVWLVWVFVLFFVIH